MQALPATCAQLCDRRTIAGPHAIRMSDLLASIYVALNAELADTMAVAEKEPNTVLTQAKT